MPARTPDPAGRLVHFVLYLLQAVGKIRAGIRRIKNTVGNYNDDFLPLLVQRRNVLPRVFQTGQKIRIFSERVEQHKTGNHPGNIRLVFNRLHKLEVDTRIERDEMHRIALPDKTPGDIGQHPRVDLVEPGQDGAGCVHQHNDVRRVLRRQRTKNRHKAQKRQSQQQ